MLKPLLSEHARRLLEDTFKTTPDRRLRDRGRHHHHSAEDLAISTRTLQRWLKAYQAQGICGTFRFLG
jgi:hypothetical protein